MGVSCPSVMTAALRRSRPATVSWPPATDQPSLRQEDVHPSRDGWGCRPLQCANGSSGWRSRASSRDTGSRSHLQRWGYPSRHSSGYARDPDNCRRSRSLPPPRRRSATATASQGEDCFLLKVHVASIEALEDVLDRFLVHGQTTSSFVVSTPVKPANASPRCSGHRCAVTPGCTSKISAVASGRKRYGRHTTLADAGTRGDVQFATGGGWS